jgi:hypothetical protein
MDESYIWLGGACGNVWITCRPGKDYLESCIAHTFKKQNSVIIWGGIIGGKKAPLVLWDRDNWGTISVVTYIENVLQPVLWPFWYWENQAHPDHTVWVMEDNASAHRASLTQAQRDHYNMPSLVWPASSPDLNPIENVWNLLKNRINQRDPHPIGVQGMREAITAEWNALTEDEILEYVDSMPERIAAVIEAGGGHTRW